MTTAKYQKSGNNKLKPEQKLREVYQTQITTEEKKKLEYIRTKFFIESRSDFIQRALEFYIKEKLGMDFEFRNRNNRM